MPARVQTRSCVRSAHAKSHAGIPLKIGGGTGRGVGDLPIDAREIPGVKRHRAAKKGRVPFSHVSLLVTRRVQCRLILLAQFCLPTFPPARISSVRDLGRYSRPFLPLNLGGGVRDGEGRPPRRCPAQDFGEGPPSTSSPLRARATSRQMTCARRDVTCVHAPSPRV